MKEIKRRAGPHVPEEISEKLTEKQILFCLLYAQEKSCFGNATASYMQAYSLKDHQRDTARQQGYQLLTNPHIKKWVRELMQQVLKPKNVDHERAKIIFQDKNLIAKNMAIAQYDKVIGRTDEKLQGKIEIVWGGETAKEKPKTKKK